MLTKAEETRMPDIQAQAARLRERRRELAERMDRVAEQLVEPRDPDVEERATERELDEVLEAEGRAAQQEVAAIDAALSRIEVGGYGICASCGNAISPERLDAVPHTALCRNCARR